jgi:hypothetical protein
MSIDLPRQVTTILQNLTKHMMLRTLNKSIGNFPQTNGENMQSLSSFALKTEEKNL